MTRLAPILILVALLSTPRVLAQSARAGWNAVTLDINGQPEPIFGYHIYYGTSQGGPYDQGFSTGNVIQTQVDDLQNGQTYYFVVTALDGAGNESGNSNEDSYTVPQEDCNNLTDDDYDGLTDCQDVECPAGSEACDGFDNDCDGTIDNNLNAPACALQDGVCAGSRQPCGGASGWQACNGSTYGADFQADETACDGLDNDCDGSTDEDCTCTPNDSRPCSIDVGECSAGVQVCAASAMWGACSGKLPGNEACDGLDNDCDGLTDEDQVCQTNDGGVDGGGDAGSDAGSDAGQNGSDNSTTVIGGCQCGSETNGGRGLWLLGLLLVFTLRRRD
ncbi:MAG TPA: fibronectin type III domain-containing protein [Myxococcota bacterium]|nr:fibronectin type III domain-containing protein [Myxococcota bacterium]